MGFSFQAGDTFYLRYPPDSRHEHLCIILCEPEGDPPTVLYAPLNTLTAQSETTVQLSPGDHPFIRHDTVVTYRLLTCEYCAEVEEKTVYKDTPVSAELLAKVVDGALISPHTERGLKRALARRTNRTI